MHEGLTIGSLFSGIGGLELGLEWAGHGPTLWQVERDEYCQRVLAKHWPNAERYDDVCTVGADLAPVDIICGGFPCQDLSYAGKGAGISEGTRSGLWFEFARIIRVARPRFVVVENVAALLGRGLGIVLGDLAACGYDATWDCIPAASVGAPHRRDRLFIVAHTRGQGLEGDGISWPVGDRDGQAGDAANPHGARGRAAEVREPGRCYPAVAGHDGQAGHVADADLVAGATPIPCGMPAKAPPPEGFGGVERRSGTSGWWQTEPDVGRVADGVPARVDRLRALGNAVVPQCGQVVGEVINLLRGE